MIHAEKLSPEGCWYLLETCDHRLALKHVVARGFGLFSAGYFRLRKQFGAERLTWINLLPPGYLLVYVWGMQEHWYRLETTPGVKRVVHIAGKPIEIRQEFIEQLHRAENQAQADEIFALERRESVVHDRRRRRRSRKSRRARARTHSRGFDIAHSIAV